MDDASKRKLAANEALAREVNERVGEVGAAWFADEEAIEFVCECSRTTCDGRIHLRRSELEQVRSSPVRFAIIRAHVVEEIECVVGEAGDAVVVEKLGVGREVAEENAH
jgi:hypothetical protein